MPGGINPTSKKWEKRMNVDAAEIMNALFELVSTWGLRVIGAIVLFIVGRMIAGSARRLVRNGAERANLDETLIPFLSGLSYYLILAVVAIAVLGIVGIQTASLLAVFGAAGLAVGLAVQGTLSNFAAGVMLLLFRPFRVGDYIEAAGTAGSVAAIGLFVTTLNTPDNVQILVPNAAVWGDTIKNYAANDTRRNDLLVGISYGDDIGKAMKIVSGVLDEDDRVLANPQPVIAVGELADSSVNLVVRPWCKKEDYWALRFDLMRTLKEELEAAGISIPFPQRDIHIVSGAETLYS
jgi:small conductance mechanosensitive channel